MSKLYNIQASYDENFLRKWMAGKKQNMNSFSPEQRNYSIFWDTTDQRGEFWTQHVPVVQP